MNLPYCQRDSLLVFVAAFSLQPLARGILDHTPIAAKVEIAKDPKPTLGRVDAPFVRAAVWPLIVTQVGARPRTSVGRRRGGRGGGR